MFGQLIIRPLTEAPEGAFLGVDWGAFVVVFAVALLATVAVVVFYALGLRLLAGGALDPVADSEGTAATAGTTVARRSGVRLAGAYTCFAVGAAAVLYGLYLIIPQFH